MEAGITKQEAAEIMSALRTYAVLKQANEAQKEKLEQRKTRKQKAKIRKGKKAQTLRGADRERLLGRARSTNGWSDFLPDSAVTPELQMPSMAMNRSYDPSAAMPTALHAPQNLKQPALQTHHTMIDLLPVLSGSDEDDYSETSDLSDGFMIPPEALAAKRESTIRVGICAGKTFGNQMSAHDPSNFASERELFLGREDTSLHATKRAKLYLDFDFGYYEDSAPFLSFEEDEPGGVKTVTEHDPLTLDFSSAPSGGSGNYDSPVSIDPPPSLGLEPAKMYTDFNTSLSNNQMQSGLVQLAALDDYAPEPERKSRDSIFVDSYHSSPTATKTSEILEGRKEATDEDSHSSSLCCFCFSTKSKKKKPVLKKEITDETNRTNITITSDERPPDKGIYITESADEFGDLQLLPDSTNLSANPSNVELTEQSNLEVEMVLRLHTDESQVHYDNFAQDPEKLRIEHMWPLEELGQGAGGTVSATLHMPMCRVYALKTTASSVNAKAHNSLVENEMKLFFWIKENLPNCPQLVKYHQCFILEDTRQFGIVMDLMDLGSLKDYMNTEEGIYFNAEQMRHITRESCLGLHALHSCKPKSLCHRDIKPDNILLSSSGSVRIADYGLVYQLESSDSLIDEVQGTQKYMSPETYEKKYGLKADVWSLGITLYECAIGEILSDEEITYFQISNGISIPSLRGKTFPDGSAIPEKLVDFVDKCLTVDPNERPSALDLLKHPYIREPIDITPEFSKKKNSYSSLEKMVTGLLLWINDSRELLGIKKPFPKEELNQDRVRNILSYTNYTAEDLVSILRTWSDKEKRARGNMAHQARCS